MATVAGIKSVHHWIGGKAVASASGRSGNVWNPATGEAQAAVDFASVQEVDHAVAVAKEAFHRGGRPRSRAEPRSFLSSANCWTPIAAAWPS